MVIRRMTASVLLLAFALPAHAFESPRVGHRGRWLTDRFGRVVITHGVNMVAKLPPYEPGAVGFDDDDATFLASEGLDSVRLGIIFKALEPVRGQFDERYLDSIAATAHMLGEHGIRVFLDFHQDLFNERFHGEGFPDWAVADDGLPAQPDAGFPGNYFVMPALWRAYDHFWESDDLQKAYAEAWMHVASRMRDETAIAGFDVFNEPWAGTAWPTCLNPDGCRLFDATLTDFYRDVFAAIRAVDPDRMLFYETHSIFAGGADVHIGDVGDPKAGFSFHSYCLGALLGEASQFLGDANCPLGADRPYDRADAQSARTGDALMLTEFGATDDLATIQRDVDAADRHMDSWQYWTYSGGDPCCARPAEGIIIDLSKPPTPANVKQAKLGVLVRPYPRAVAGVPVSYSFDPSTKSFDLTFDVDSSIDAPTEIFVPARQYVDGYTVEVTGPGQIVSGPGDSILLLEGTGDGRVHVNLIPSG